MFNLLSLLALLFVDAGRALVNETAGGVIDDSPESHLCRENYPVPERKSLRSVDRVRALWEPVPEQKSLRSAGRIRALWKPVPEQKACAVPVA
jgi:hypothetical protein